MPSSSNPPLYFYFPILGAPFWVLFHPNEEPQPPAWFPAYPQTISGGLTLVNGVHIYPPPGLANPPPGNPQVQQISPASSSWEQPPLQSPAASSWEQPAHLVGPPPPPPIIPLANQMQFKDLIQHDLSIMPFLSIADIAQLSAVGGMNFFNVLPPRPPSAYTSLDLNAIGLNKAGALFLNSLIYNKQLTNQQISYLDSQHINLLNDINLQSMLLPQTQNQNQPISPGEFMPTLTRAQIHGLDMLHLYTLGNYERNFQTLTREHLLNGFQRYYTDHVFLRGLVTATNNQNYGQNGISFGPGHSFSCETQIIQQLFIMAAGYASSDRNPPYLPGVGAASLLEASTLSYLLPSGGYVVTELFYLYANQNAIQSSGGQFAISHAPQTGNVSWLIQGSTLNQISKVAFAELIRYMNAHNAQIHFSLINLQGLSNERFNDIADQTLFQAFIGAQSLTDSWLDYLQTHHGVNNWGTLVHSITLVNVSPPNGNNGVTAEVLHQFFLSMADFARHRITILQEMYDNMTEEQRLMFNQYYISGGRRTEQLTADSEIGIWADGYSVNAHTLQQLLIQESHQEVRADTKTTTSVRPGETMNGKLENNQDHDWYKVDVKAGITYKFILKHTNNTDHLDPWLNLRGTNGKIIKSDDDSAGNLNSLIQFKATQNATYYLDACSWRETSHGQFSLSVMSV